MITLLFPHSSKTVICHFVYMVKEDQLSHGVDGLSLSSFGNNDCLSVHCKYCAGF